jgi:DNA-binding NarL/FixJ family response regulator
MADLLLMVHLETKSRRALQSALPKGDRLIGAASVRAAIALIRAGRFSAAIIDIEQPDGSGLELAAFLRARAHPTPVLLVTETPRREEMNDAHRLGAEFLWKPCPTDRLADFTRRSADHASRAPLHGKGVIEREQIALVAYAKRHAFTTSELRIVELAVAGLDNAEIRAHLGKTENTIKSAVRSLLQKCDARSLADVVQRVSREALDAATR